MRIGPFESTTTPELASLFQYVVSVEEFYPDDLIVADTPFLVYWNGQPCSAATQNIHLLSSLRIYDECVLKVELLKIAQCLRGDYYTEDTLLRIEYFAKVTYPEVRDAINISIKSFKATLLREHRLN